jgi:hypothetical protein
METLNLVLLFAHRLLGCIARDFLPEIRPAISMLGPARLSESSDTGLHCGLTDGMTDASATRRRDAIALYAYALISRTGKLSAPSLQLGTRRW